MDRLEFEIRLSFLKTIFKNLNANQYYRSKI